MAITKSALPWHKDALKKMFDRMRALIFRREGESIGHHLPLE
jgi:hypothetical protein